VFRRCCGIGGLDAGHPPESQLARSFLGRNWVRTGGDRGIREGFRGLEGVLALGDVERINKQYGCSTEDGCQHVLSPPIVSLCCVIDNPSLSLSTGNTGMSAGVVDPAPLRGGSWGRS